MCSSDGTEGLAARLQTFRAPQLRWEEPFTIEPIEPMEGPPTIHPLLPNIPTINPIPEDILYGNNNHGGDNGFK